MIGLVVPFRGRAGKSRLRLASDNDRSALALAMLGDVLEACVAVGETVVVGDGAAEPLTEELGARYIAEPGGGQGGAVAAGLAELGVAPILVVNADLPCVRAGDLAQLAGTIPPDGVALVDALDGTTNALGLARRDLFAPLYGPGSASRFRVHAERLGARFRPVEVANLRDDVDTLDDLERLEGRLGRRTREAVNAFVALSR